jgi:signal recognition particle subunit SRP54
MFQNLSNKLGKVFDGLRGRGLLTEADIDEAMREVRISLLEADVALPVAKDFIEKTKAKIIGAEVVKSISPVQMVIKLVQDSLTEMLGGEVQELNFNAAPPVVVMMVGLQGSGKTTSTGKLALRLKSKQGKKVLVASTDIYRPAAQEQLKILAEKTGVVNLDIIEGQKPLEITKRAIAKAKAENFDVLIIDTAGRTHIDDELIAEASDIKKLANPTEILLVADSLTGQDALTIAKTFNEKLAITGLVLTRLDSDARGGAALSMKAVTGVPIKFVGIGEKPEDFEEFYPDRIAGRILDKGDIVGLVEKAKEQIDEAEAKRMEAKFKKGEFDLDDLAKQMDMMGKMGGFGSILGMIPGLGKMKNAIEEKMGDDATQKQMRRMRSIINSMTKAERRDPVKVINGSRKQRISKGAGVDVADVNRLLKQHRNMADMMKKLGKMDQKTLMRSGGLQNMLKGGGFGGGF